MRKTVLSSKVSIALESVALGESVSTEGFLGDLLGKVKGLFSRPKNLNELKKLVDARTVRLGQISDELKKTILKPGWLDDVTLKETIELSVEVTQRLSFKGTVDKNLLDTVEPGFASAKRYFTSYAPKVKEYATHLDKLPKRIEREARDLDDGELEEYVTDLVKELLKLKAPSDGVAYPVHLPGSVTLNIRKKSFGTHGTLAAVESSMTKVTEGMAVELTPELLVRLAKVVVEAIELNELVHSIYNIGLDYGFDDEDLYERFNSTESVEAFWDLTYYQRAWDNWAEGVYGYDNFVKELIRLISNSVK